MFRLINIIAASGLSLILAACETAPMVVEDLPPPDMSTSRELLILPLSGMSPTVGFALGEKMAWGMREAGYPARSANLSNDVNPMLTGWVEEASGGGDIVWLNINWTLYDSGGTLVGDYRQETAVSRSGWMRLSPDTLAVIVAQAVPAIHEIAEVEIYPGGMPEIEPRRDETAAVELTPPKPETIVVSGEGLSRIDSDGNEMADQQLSVAQEPAFAPEYEPEETVRTEYPEGFSANEMTASETTTNETATNETVASGISQNDPDFLHDDVGKLTPETAALVTTRPELTISETIAPGQDMTAGESLQGAVSEPQQVGMAPGLQQQSTQQQQGGSPTQMADTIPAAQPEQTAQQMQQQPAPPVSPAPSVAPATPQPALSGGNAALGFVRPVFLVRHIAGAPGDGNLALRSAMLQSLREADAMVTDSPPQASYVLQGSVQMSAPFAGRQHTRIIWLVTTITGEEVGTAIQENDIPQGSLDGQWGPVARIITNAAIPGVAKLFDTALDAGTAQGNLAQPDLPHVIEGTQP